MNARGKACAACVAGVTLAALAYVVAGSVAGTYALFSDSERVPASVAAAPDFGPVAGTEGVAADALNPTVAPSAAAPTPISTATPAPTAVVTPTVPPALVPTPVPAPSATPEPGPGGIQGSVSCQGQPVVGAQVSVVGPHSPATVAWWGATEGDGTFNTGFVLEAGSYVVSILAPDTSYDSIPATVPAQDWRHISAQCVATHGPQ